jgi:hypothetical protein
MDKTSSNANSRVKEPPPIYRETDRLLRDDAKRVHQACADPDWLKSQFTKLVERLCEEGIQGDLDELLRPYVDLTGEPEQPPSDRGRCSQGALSPAETTHTIVPPAIEEFLQALDRCRTVPDVTQALLVPARYYGFCNIRCYLYDALSQKLFAVDAAGHTPEVTTLLRIGEIEKRRGSSPLRTCDAYWCLDMHEPILVEVNNVAQPPFRGVRRRDGLLQIMVPELCPVLASHRQPVHADIPFPDSLGKVSCDFAQGCIPEDAAQRIAAFARFVQVAARYLSDLYYRSIDGPLSRAKIEVQRSGSLADLATCCVRTLPARFDCQAADLFVMAEDDLGSRALVLHSTSDPRNRGKEYRLAFRLTHHDCVAWVAANRRALLLDTVGDEELLRKQLAAYGIQKLSVSRVSKGGRKCGLLALPAMDPSGKLRAVYCLLRTRRQENGLHFTERDLVLAQKFCSECLGPMLESLTQRQARVQMPQHVELANRISVRDYGAFSELLEDVGEALRTFIPEQRSQKLYLLNLLDGRGHFRHRYVGGRLERTSQLLATFPLENTLTQRILNSSEGFYYVNDIDQAARCGAILRIAEKAVCAMGARISFECGASRVKRRDFGTLIVMSDQQDIHPQEHGPFLRLLAERTGENLARRDIHGLLLRGLSEEIAAAQDQLRRLVAEVRQCIFDTRHRESLDSCLAMLTRISYFNEQAMAAAAELARPIRFMSASEWFNVREAINDACTAIGRGDCVRNEIAEDLAVEANRGFLMTIICKLLKYSRCSRKLPAVISGDVTVGSGARNEVLSIWVDGVAEGFSLRQIDEFFQCDPTTEICRPGWDTAHALGLRMARSFAQRHEFPDGRCGRLLAAQSPKNGASRFVLDLPVRTSGTAQGSPCVQPPD